MLLIKLYLTVWLKVPRFLAQTHHIAATVAPMAALTQVLVLIIVRIQAIALALIAVGGFGADEFKFTNEINNG